MDKLDEIRAKAIDLVAVAIEDEDIPAAKRADMALSLLGKQAVKDDRSQPKLEPVTVWFHVVDEHGNHIRSKGYEFEPRRETE